MPRYIIERNVPNLGDMTAEEREAASRKAIEIANQMPGVVWIKSYVSEVEGKFYCFYEAPNPEAILEHARRGGFPVDKISEIGMEVSPEMFV